MNVRTKLPSIYSSPKVPLDEALSHQDYRLTWKEDQAVIIPCDLHETQDMPPKAGHISLQQPLLGRHPDSLCPSSFGFCDVIDEEDPLHEK